MSHYYVANVDGRGGRYDLNRGYRYLGQDMPPLDVTQDPSTGDFSGGTSLSADDVTTFSSWWGKFQSAWSDLQGIPAEIGDHRARWSAVFSGAAAVGDGATEDLAVRQTSALDTARGLYDEIMAKIQSYSGTWDQIKSYVSSLGQWVGLGIFPILLPVAAVAAIAALAYVVNRYLELRANLNADLALLQSAEAGRISSDAAAKMMAARRAGLPGGGPASTLSSLTTLGLVGLVGLVVWKGIGK